MIEIPRGWTNAMYDSSSQQYLEQILLNGLIAAGIGRKEGRQAFTSQPRILRFAFEHVLYVHHMWHADTIHEIDPVRAQEMKLKFY